MKPIVAANWKMNFTIDESLNLIDEIIKRSPSVGAEIIFFPNYISLQSVKQKLVDTAYMVGSQNVHHDESGAFTGEVSASMLSILDLDYVEDSNAETDLNLVMTDSLELIEIQGTAEEAPFSKDQLNQMLELGSSAIADIIEKQKACLK
jgi:ribonuclease PH